MRSFAFGVLGLESFFRQPGDGRKRSQIPASDVVWAQIAGQILRCTSFHGIERLMRHGPVRGVGLSRGFSEDTLAYFNDRLNSGPVREALLGAVRRAKRNKAFQGHPRLGLAIDGTSAGRTGSKTPVCELCRPTKDSEGEITGHRHELAFLMVVGVGLTLPIDAEGFGPGDSELAAGRRLLQRAAPELGPRFADYVVVDAKFGCAPFLNEVPQLGLHAVVRLKDNLPTLHGRAAVRFNSRPPDKSIDHHGEPVEIWDEEGFQPWDGLEWSAVRVIRYRQHRHGKSVVEAYWLTDYTQKELGSYALFKMAKSRWEIENEGFNEAKTWHGMRHICRHKTNAVEVGWLLLALALVIERLYRERHLHRGSHPARSAADLAQILMLELGRWPRVHDTS